MPSPDLLSICVTAFIAVFLLLALLALIMRLILLVYPKKEEVTDAALLASVTGVMQTVFPGTRVTKIEEIQ